MRRLLWLPGTRALCLCTFTRESRSRRRRARSRGKAPLIVVVSVPAHFVRCTFTRESEIEESGESAIRRFVRLNRLVSGSAPASVIIGICTLRGGRHREAGTFTRESACAPERRSLAPVTFGSRQALGARPLSNARLSRLSRVKVGQNGRKKSGPKAAFRAPRVQSTTRKACEDSRA